MVDDSQISFTRSEDRPQGFRFSDFSPQDRIKGMASEPTNRMVLVGDTWLDTYILFGDTEFVSLNGIANVQLEALVSCGCEVREK